MKRFLIVIKVCKKTDSYKDLIRKIKTLVVTKTDRTFNFLRVVILLLPNVRRWFIIYKYSFMGQELDILYRHKPLFSQKTYD